MVAKETRAGLTRKKLRPFFTCRHVRTSANSGETGGNDTVAAPDEGRGSH